jgi:hypothetical protein
VNVDKERTRLELSRRSPFWVCLLVFLLLACDYGFRLNSLLDQREQLNQVLLMQAKNMGVLTQRQQLERRLEAFSLDLLEVARTNATAKQIVQDFNIQWNPNPPAVQPVPATTNHHK